MENKEEDIWGKIAVTINGAGLIFAVIYLLCSFYSATFSISNWSSDTRLCCAIVGGFLAFAIGTFIWIGLKKY